jgi:hypothetical protein
MERLLYERLSPDMQQAVDAWAERLAAVGWQRRGDLLAEAARPFADRFEGARAQLASRGFLTAVLERLESGDEVSDVYQACLYRLSLHPHHRLQADRYLEEHPEMQAVVDAELAGDDRGSAPN